MTHLHKTPEDYKTGTGNVAGVLFLITVGAALVWAGTEAVSRLLAYIFG